MVKPPLRTKSIGFKVSEEEYAQLETAAQADDRTLGEWCRELVMASGQETKPTGPSGAEAQALMAELVLFFLREKKFNKIDCIKVLRAEYAMSMVEAKEAVDHSDAWSDRFRSDMQLRETAWKALRDIAASQDPNLPKIIIEGDAEG